MRHTHTHHVTHITHTHTNVTLDDGNKILMPYTIYTHVVRLGSVIYADIISYSYSRMAGRVARCLLSINAKICFKKGKKV